jgi:predicted nucleic acid-binding protein
MDVLIDTGVLLRLVVRSDPAHTEGRTAIRTLKSRGDKLITLTQNAAEFCNVCTRPQSARGGYGLTIQDTGKKLSLVERLMEIRPESRAAFEEWKRLIIAHGVQGAKVYDARIVAAMTAYRITSLMTFNSSDFKRFPGITVLEPKDILSQQQTRP